jgi:hypothetical protein
MKNLPPDFFRTLRYYVVEIASTVVFIWWIVKSMWHELK